MAERQGGSRVQTRRMADYEARQAELTSAFVLPDDLRRWVTVRMDDNPDTDDTLTVGVQAGRTTTLLTMPIPGDVRRLLREVIKDNQDKVDSQLKLDLATNMLAFMGEPPE